MTDDMKRVLATARATKAQMDKDMDAGTFDPITARMYINRACDADPNLRAAIKLLIDEAVETGTEFEDEARRYHMSEHGKNCGRPVEIKWNRVLEIDAGIDPRITKKTERAAIIRRRMDEEKLHPPNHTDLRARLPKR